MADDLDDLLAFADAHAADRLALTTVIATWGSSPRPVGSHMLVTADGRFSGSVSGGCVEGDVITTAMAIAAGAPARVRDYGVEDATAWQVGLPCGGNIRILIQPVGDHGFPPALFAQIKEARAARQVLTIATDTMTGFSMVGDLQGADLFLRPYHPQRRMLIVGGVQIAQHLARLARDLAIDVTINDPRATYLAPARFPDIRLNDDWPDQAVTAFAPGPEDALVTLSHDPKLDDPALIAALGSDTGYVAALGSRKSHAARLDRLRTHGLTEESLSRIDGPAGLSIGAVGPAEIALSVLAGAVAAWRKVVP